MATKVFPGISYTFDYAKSGVSYFSGGVGAVFRDTTRWLSHTHGVKNLIVRPLDLVAQWAEWRAFVLPPALLKICGDMSRLKIILGAIEAITKFETYVISEPKKTRQYSVITTDCTERSIAEMAYSDVELRFKHIGSYATWVFNLTDVAVYLRNSTILSLGAKGLTRISWIVTLSGTIASVQGLVAEGQFLYQMAMAEKHQILNYNSRKEIIKLEVKATLAWEEIGHSMIKVALHVSNLALVLSFAFFLVGYTATFLRTAKLIALTSITVLTIASHYWGSFAIGQRVIHAAGT